MATTTPTLTPRTLIAAGTSNAAGATTRGVLDLRGKHGGLLTIKLSNGGTGPTVPAEGRVLVAHNSGATPAAASAGVDWKTHFVFGGGTTNSAVTEQSFVMPPCCHLEVEITGNTGQAVGCEALMTEYTDLQTT